MPHLEDSLLARPLAALTRSVVRRPRTVAIVSLLVAVVALAATARGLGFRTSRLDLLNPRSPYNQLWLEYIGEFGDEDDVVLVVESPRREWIDPAKAELARAIAARDDLFHAVLHEIDLSSLRSKALYFTPPETLGQMERFLGQLDPLLEGDWTPLALGPRAMLLSAHLGQLPPSDDGRLPEPLLAELERLGESLATALADGPAAPPLDAWPWSSMDEQLTALRQVDAQYLRTDDGWLGFVLLRLRQQPGRLAPASHGIDDLRAIIAEVSARHPQVEIGLTGLPVLEDDEMRSSQSDMIVASVVSLVGVSVLFIAALGGLRHPLLCIVALLIGMAWAFGYVTLAVGHLNILSIAFGVILIGLGIDFGIHYVARYLHARRRLPKSRAALVETAAAIGPGIVTGGLTTSIAFFAAALTDFTGVAELGVIAGGGILLCIVAALVLLPALIAWIDQRRDDHHPPEPLHVAHWTVATRRHPWLVAGAMSLATVGLGVAAGWLDYDHNLLNLQPDGLESVRLERKLLDEADRSVWYAISVADSTEELRARIRRFEQAPSVDRTESLASLLPEHEPDRQAVIARLGARLADLPERPPTLAVTPPELLGQELARLQHRLVTGDRATQLARSRLEHARDLLRRLPAEQYYERLSRRQHALASELLSRLLALREMASPEPPQLADLPEPLVTRFVGANGKHLLKIYARGDIWDMQSLARFVREVKAIDPRATGNPLQTYYASRQMQRSYVHAAVYATLAVLIVLVIDFRSVRFSLLALSPVVLGMLQLFGVMALLGIPLNPANMIVLPLILGIGLDDGVHVVHDFRQQSGPYRLSNSTAMSVVLTSLTTMVGFGSLMLAHHQGLQSLGRVLTIGVGCCLVTSLLFLPAVLTLVRGGHREEARDDARPADAAPTRRRAA